MLPKGVEAQVENTIIMTGSGQGIYLIFDVFIDPGDTVLIESPTFLNTINVLRKMDANIIGVEMDEDGIIIEDLEEKIKRHHPKLLYTIPTFQNPKMCIRDSSGRQCHGAAGNLHLLCYAIDRLRRLP